MITGERVRIDGDLVGGSVSSVSDGERDGVRTGLFVGFELKGLFVGESVCFSRGPQS